MIAESETKVRQDRLDAAYEAVDRGDLAAATTYAMMDIAESLRIITNSVEEAGNSVISLGDLAKANLEKWMGHFAAGMMAGFGMPRNGATDD